jgi:pyrroloquinoline quinone biosynthesis protein E
MASATPPAPDHRLDRFPVLADHVRLQPLTDYVKVVHLRSGQVVHLSRQEAICLELARGGSCLGEIAQVVQGVYDLDGEAAVRLAEATLDPFGEDLQWLDTPTTPRTASDPLRLFRIEPDLHPPARYRQERPTRLTLSVTAVCNYRCRHCSNDSGSRMPGELSDDEWCEVIRSAGRIGVVGITFSGGEPLTRPGLPRLIAEASRAGIFPILSTNASLIDRDVARDLAAAGLPFAHVGLSAASGTSFDLVTGRRGWRDRAVAGVRHLHAEGIYVRLKTVLMPTTVDEVPSVLDLASDLGVDEVHLAPYRLTHLAPAGPCLLLTPEQIASVQATVQRWRAATGSALEIRTPDPQEERLAWSNPQDVVRCGGVKEELTVLPDGAVTLCEVLKDRPEFVLGHALRDGLMAIWQSPRPEQVVAEAAGRASGACRSCEHLAGCGTGCFSLSLACGGESSSPDPRCWRSTYPGNPFRTTNPGEGMNP